MHSATHRSVKLFPGSPGGTNVAAHRAGLTLLELLVVLTILIILTGIAFVATDQFIDQARYTTTQQTLQNIQNAIIGPPGQQTPNGSLLITGFVADMGQLPQVPATGDPLSQLWDVTTIPTTSLYGVQTVTLYYDTAMTQPLYYPASPTQVTATLNCGWRGPYIQMVTGSNGKLVDGWGNPFQTIFQQTASPYTLTAPATVGESIHIVRSLGADNAVDPNPLPTTYTTSLTYNRDLYAPDQVFTAAQALPTPLASFSGQVGSVPVTVQCINTTVTPTALTSPIGAFGQNNVVRIVLYTPKNGMLTAFQQMDLNGNPTADVTLPAPPDAMTTPTPTTVSTTFVNVSIGPRAVQAFQFDPGTQVVRKRSPITYLMVPVGGPPTTTLILQ